MPTKEMSWNEFVSEYKPIEFNTTKLHNRDHEFDIIEKYFTMVSESENYPPQHMNCVFLHSKRIDTIDGPEFQTYLSAFGTNLGRIVTRKPNDNCIIVRLRNYKIKIKSITSYID